MLIYICSYLQSQSVLIFQSNAVIDDIIFTNDLSYSEYTLMSPGKIVIIESRVLKCPYNRAVLGTRELSDEKSRSPHGMYVYCICTYKCGKNGAFHCQI